MLNAAEQTILFNDAVRFCAYRKYIDKEGDQSRRGYSDYTAGYKVG
jgi:hypothetical protein